MPLQLAHRNLDLPEIVGLLKDQQLYKNDVIVSPDKLSVVTDGTALPFLVVKEAEPQLSEHGVTNVDGEYQISDRFLSTVATRLNVPGAFLKRMYATRGDVFAEMVNLLFNGSGHYGPFPKNSLVRLFTATEGEEQGLARCIVSDSYKIIDNLDTIIAVLQGLEEAGIDPNDIVMRRGDISETRMRMSIEVPEVTAVAATLLEGYRDPRSGNTNNNIVHASLSLQNSETGSGALGLYPEAIAKICSNGMTAYKLGNRAVHLGTRLDEGLVKYETDTHAANNNAIRLAVRDSVKQFLTPEFLEKVVEHLTEKAGKHVTEPKKVIERVSKKLQFTDSEQEGILTHFLLGGQATSGGVMQAVTSYVQDVEDPDRAYHLSSNAVTAMELV